MRPYDRPADAGAAGDPPPDDEEVQEIRVEIEQTRTEMSGTIEAIQQKLNPETLAEQAKEVARDVTEYAVREAKEAARDVTDHAVREAKGAAREAAEQVKDAAWDATVGRAEHAVEATVEKAEEVVTTAGQTAMGVGSMVMDTIKQHPIPAALAGLSIGWLWMNRATGPAATSYQAHRPGGASAYPGSPTTYTGEDRSTLGGIADKVGDTAGQAQEKVGRFVSSAGEMAGDVASSAGEIAGDVASSAGETATDLGSTILETIRENPVPAALTGLGLGWLFLNRSSQRRAPQPAYRGSELTSPYGRTRVNLDQERSTGADLTSDVTQAAGRAVGKAGNLVGGAGEMAAGAVSEAGEMAADAVSSASDLAGDIVDQAQEQVQWATGRVERMVQDNPLAAGALALAVGTAVGLAVPGTRRENELMGSARDSLVDQVGDVARDAVEKVQHVAGEAQDTVKKEAELQGLTV